MTTLDFEDALFQSIAALIHEQRQGTQRDRRDIARHPYRCIQLIAEFDGQNLPEQHEFQQVQCHDLSPQGFSYVTNRRPDTRHLVVALGRVPFKFLVAEVVRVAPRDPSSPLEFQIGCRFMRRITGD
ncbi:MAG: hypothetical protein AB7F89_04305 [Pirellulaceae bacterium]